MNALLGPLAVLVVFLALKKLGTFTSDEPALLSLVKGETYRIRGHVTPAFNEANQLAFVAAVRNTGAYDLEVSADEDSTLFAYTQTQRANRAIETGKPILSVGGYEALIDSAVLVP